MYSVFGNTSRGVPSPYVPATHPYPTRFHGPLYGIVQADPVYVPATWAVPPFNGFGACCDSCAKGGPCAGSAKPALGACAPCLAAAALAGTPGPLHAGGPTTGDKWADAAVGALLSAAFGTLFGGRRVGAVSGVAAGIAGAAAGLSGAAVAGMTVSLLAR